MEMITSKLHEKGEEKKKYKSTPKFVPAGQTTQMIIGATPDYDMNILKLSEGLYNRYQLKRVYYSAYVPIGQHPNLPAIAAPPLLREHRLYQADWLLRFYGFQAKELLDDRKPNFDIALDPKCDWALRNLEQFPVEVNRADYEMLLRIPGVGVRSAMRIVAARRFTQLDYEDLKKLGVVLKRARYFVTCKGRYYGDTSINEERIRYQLTLGDPVKKDLLGGEQLSLFSVYPQMVPPKETLHSIMGDWS
jgi:predicted DNA-binding helix-hairpin-helix protein